MASVREGNDGGALALPSTANAMLPAAYERAKESLAACVRIDECKDWADKAAALASYAKQSGDTTLRDHAMRIQGRAIRRCGEMLNAQRPAKGGDYGNAATGGRTPVAGTRAALARDAGLSRDQQRTALRVGSIPAADFEKVIDAPEGPPTVTALAEMGKRAAPKPLFDLGGRDPKEFEATTRAHGALSRFVEMAAGIEPAVVVRASSAHERRRVVGQVTTAIAWLQRLREELEAT